MVSSVVVDRVRIPTKRAEEADTVCCVYYSHKTTTATDKWVGCDLFELETRTSRVAHYGRTVSY